MPCSRKPDDALLDGCFDSSRSIMPYNGNEGGDDNNSYVAPQSIQQNQ